MNVEEINQLCKETHDLFVEAYPDADERNISKYTEILGRDIQTINLVLLGVKPMGIIEPSTYEHIPTDRILLLQDHPQNIRIFSKMSNLVYYLEYEHSDANNWMELQGVHLGYPPMVCAEFQKRMSDGTGLLTDDKFEVNYHGLTFIAYTSLWSDTVDWLKENVNIPAKYQTGIVIESMKTREVKKVGSIEEMYKAVE